MMGIVDVLDEAAAGFYAGGGFVPPSDSLWAVLPVCIARGKGCAVSIVCSLNRADGDALGEPNASFAHRSTSRLLEGDVLTSDP